MSWWSDFNDAFMEGLKSGPSESLFGGLRVKRTPSPIDPRVLAAQQHRVAAKLTQWHEKLRADLYAPEDTSIPDIVGRYEAWSYFAALDIEEPDERYLLAPLQEFVTAMAAWEPMCQAWEAVTVEELAATERLRLHERLFHLEQVLKDPERYLTDWSNHLYFFAEATLKALPENIRTASMDMDLSLSCPLIDCLPNPHEHLASALRHFEGCDSVEMRDLGLYAECQDKLLSTTLAVSNLELADLATKQPDSPLDHQDTPAAALVSAFFAGTPFRSLFLTAVPYGL